MSMQLLTILYISEYKERFQVGFSLEIQLDIHD